jgi:beta-glucosidase
MKRLNSFIMLLMIGHCSISMLAQYKNSTSTKPEVTSDKFITIGTLKFRDFNRNGKLDIYEDYRKPIEQRAKDLLSKMTMEEKLVQLRCPWMGKAKLFTHNEFNYERAIDAFPNGLGEVARLSDGNAFLNQKKAPNSSEIPVLANDVQKFFINNTRLGIPVLFQEEGVHGLAIKDGTMFPSALGMSCSWNEELSSEVFTAIAEEARATGIHRVLAPVLDLALDPRWGRTEETMGEDPYLVTRLGLAKVKALQGNSDTPDSTHVAALIKHIGAHGQPEGGSNAGPVFISERQLREVNLKPFKAAIIEGKAMGVMPNYNEISGIPTHANRWLLTNVLRKEWGFKGIVNSDYNATVELMDFHHVAANAEDAAWKALNAGVDIEQSDRYMYASLSEAIKDGKTTLDKLNQAVLHVLEQKFRLGLFDHPYMDVHRAEIVGCEAHRTLALKAACQSMVLLKNDNDLLPLDRTKVKKIAVIGPNADQCILGGYSHIPRTTVTPLDAIKEKYNDVKVVYAQGCGINKAGSKYGATVLLPHEENLKLIQAAMIAAKDVDVIVLVLGGNDKISREATMPTLPGDLVNLELLGDQNELVDSLKTLNKPIAAFVFSGPPISFVHLKKSVPAIVQCWYLGQETGYAVAETLFGDNNPSGKLSMSIPRSAGHLPDYYYSKPTARIRPYNLDSISPLYPFGFGLSYTNYVYSNLKISKPTISANENVTVTVDIKNIGERAGVEIVQLYIRDEVSSVTRPVKELKDFKRIALNPGEVKQVSFIITPDKLKFYDIDMKEVIEPGDFDIMVGSSSQKYDIVKLTVL